ncbi:hypothetical protein PR048_029473 [Dryococelus australis]|uniref:Uncharacterized protein n=1 Tax=Dryococelus australis TaxID=614101 RepID=A0ABQ9GG97_9NEOP|nr:hypothetical protein PR048_029473 [Dryococelus australis]
MRMGVDPGRSNTLRMTGFPAGTRETLRWSGAGVQGRGKREYPEKARQQAASPSTIPTCEIPGANANSPGIEPGSPRNRVRLERASEKQSSDAHKTPYDRVKRCRERKIIKASESVNIPKKTRQPAASSITIRTCENPGAAPPWNITRFALVGSDGPVLKNFEIRVDTLFRYKSALPTNTLKLRLTFILTRFSNLRGKNRKRRVRPGPRPIRSTNKNRVLEEHASVGRPSEVLEVQASVCGPARPSPTIKLGLSPWNGHGKLGLSPWNGRGKLGLSPWNGRGKLGLSPWNGRGKLRLSPPWNGRGKLGLSPWNGRGKLGLSPWNGRGKLGLSPWNGRGKLRLSPWNGRGKLGLSPWNGRGKLGLIPWNGHGKLGLSPWNGRGKLGLSPWNGRGKLGLSPWNGRGKLGLSPWNGRGKLRLSPPWNGRGKLGLSPWNGRGKLGLSPWNGHGKLGLSPWNGHGKLGLSPWNGHGKLRLSPWNGHGKLRLSPWNGHGKQGLSPWNGHGKLGISPWNGHGKLGISPWNGHGKLRLSPPWNGHGKLRLSPWNGHGKLRLSPWNGHGKLGLSPWNVHGKLGLSPWNGHGKLGLSPWNGHGKLRLSPWNGHGKLGLSPWNVHGKLGLSPWNGHGKLGLSPWNGHGKLGLSPWNGHGKLGLSPWNGHGKLGLSPWNGHGKQGLSPWNGHGKLGLSPWNGHGKPARSPEKTHDDRHAGWVPHSRNETIDFMQRLRGMVRANLGYCYGDTKGGGKDGCVDRIASEVCVIGFKLRTILFTSAPLVRAGNDLGTVAIRASTSWSISLICDGSEGSMFGWKAVANVSASKSAFSDGVQASCAGSFKPYRCQWRPAELRAVIRAVSQFKEYSREREHSFAQPALALGIETTTHSFLSDVKETAGADRREIMIS